MTNNPIPWLTDGENPAVTYLVKNELLKYADNEEIYCELLRSELTDYFKQKFLHGVLGDFRHPDLYYRGSVWFFLLAVESGYKYSADFVASTADNLCIKTQLGNGGFKFDLKSSDAVGCRSGNMIYSLLKSGISDSRTVKGVDWIVKNQRSDGGWLHCPVAGFCDVLKLVLLNRPGNGLKYETDAKIMSCPVASYSCLKALVQSGEILNSDSVRRGADFFLRNNFFVKTGGKMFCGDRLKIEKPGYPVMSQYDYLAGLVLLSGIGKSCSPISGELFNSIIKKQNADGSWNNENRSSGMIREKPGRSRWTTLNALRFIKNAVAQEDQFEKA